MKRGRPGEELMDHEPPYERVGPTDTVTELGVRPWVMVLGDWRNARHDPRAIIARIEKAFQTWASPKTLPTVLVVDNTDEAGAEHQALLTDLVAVGALVLGPESEDERAAVASDPLSF